MSTSPSPTSVDPTRIMPGSFEKSVAETEYDAWTISVTDTPYVAKSAQANQSTAWDSVRTALFPWLTLRTSQDLSNGNGGRHIQSMFKNASLLAIVGLFWLFGTAGMSWLWYIWRSKAIWLVINILSPGLLHSLVGLITTLVNTYTAQGGRWSITAKIIIIVVGLCTGNISALYFVYNHWILEKMKTPRDKAVAKRNRS